MMNLHICTGRNYYRRRGKSVSTPKSTLWDLEPHTRAKHEILRRYLGAWMSIIGSTFEKWVYVDGFSGPGRYSNNEEGSPLIALKTAMGLKLMYSRGPIFCFHEQNAERLQCLRQNIADISIPSRFRVFLEQGDFSDKYKPTDSRYCDNNRKPFPTFAFLDPFGFSGVPFSKVEEILSHDRCEVFINFSIDSINRFIGHPNDATCGHIIDAFGSQECVEIAKNALGRAYSLRNHYAERLGTIARHVRHFEMRTKGGKLSYYLFFATNHRLGHIRMKEAMLKVGGTAFGYSAVEGPDQLELFVANAPEQVADSLLKRYDQSECSYLKMRAYIEDDTDHLKRHLDAALKRLEQDGKITVTRQGSGRTRLSFKDGDRIDFKPPMNQQLSLFLNE